MIADRFGKVISRIRELSRSDIIADHGPRAVTFTLRCRVKSPLPYSQQELERAFSVTLPPDLVSLWNQTGGLRVYEDVSYGQWGLVIWDPEEAIRRNASDAPEIEYRPNDFRRGDLLIGHFLGDADLLLVRCEPAEGDFGSLLIPLPIEHRRAWPMVARSLPEFLERYLDSPERKFWSKGRPGYQRADESGVGPPAP